MTHLELSDDRLRRFLLGQLEESERQEIERACLDPDDATFAEIAAAEDELRADYAQGALSADERARFVERYLTTSDGRHRQDFMAALVAKATPATAATVAAPSRVWWRRPGAQMGLAAAALILAALSGVMLGTVHGLQNRLARVETTQGRTTPPVGPGGSTELARVQADLAREQARAADLERRLVEAGARPRGPLLALWLAPGVTRGPGGEIPRVPEAEVAQGLRASLLLPPAIELPKTCAAALTDADGKIVWSSGALTPRDRAVTVTIPPALLRRGDYQIVVRGGDTAASLSDLATYDLRIVG